MDRPREKAMLYGLRRLNEQELLCLVLGSGQKQYSVDQLADQVLEKTDNLRRLLSIEPEQLMEIDGIGQARALGICASMELARRALEVKTVGMPVYGGEDVRLWCQAMYGTLSQEHVAVLYLDTKNRVLRYKDLFVGTIDQALIHPREIFREACLCAASSILVVHNHPSDDPIPSIADLESTKQLALAARVHQIELLDHVIVGKTRSFSFRDHHLLEDDDMP